MIVADGAAALRDFSFEEMLLESIKKKHIPYLVVFNKQDEWTDLENNIGRRCDICVSAVTGYHIRELKDRIVRKMPKNSEEKPLIADLLSNGDTVVLVVPIDSAAPKGRLILPQQQVIRDCLEAGAAAVVCRETELASTLARLAEKPKIVVTDSQAFSVVAEQTKDDILLTSFSILFSRYKGDLEEQIKGIRAVSTLRHGDRILMAEGCTHHRQCGDIGTVKIPRWLQEYTGKQLVFETSSGGDFPESLSSYALIVHCGGCMLPPREMANRIGQAKSQHVPIVNYGILIAHLKGVLKRSIQPFEKDIGDWDN